MENNTLATPASNAATINRAVVSTPSQAATGTLTNTTNDTTSQTSNTRFLGKRSIHAPAGNPNNNHGTQANT
ncbi:hypothetical protein Raf01_50450 [Rugosimonospora africana]|uniref:Uncharacterized protein n=1 Tax=Rugosimonospora africana TaxID=556532 RepID=A0A8J3VSV6_9ACTN|nr:hypothetical protein Raf01_50450 [Rugosimonospora africana]